MTRLCGYRCAYTVLHTNADIWPFCYAMGVYMVHNLYRFYLYTVFIVLVVFAAVALGQLLNTVLLLIPFLRDSYNTVPDSARVTQSLVFALVSWAIAGLLGGLHYWLIRRDIRNDAMAGTSAIRSFFLNTTEAIGILLAVPFIGFSVLGQLAYNQQYGLAGTLAYTFPALCVVILLELERRRTLVTTGAALAFQRLHVYGVQLIFLVLLATVWERYVNSLIDALFFSGTGAREYCGNTGSCHSENISFLLLTLLWFVAFWLGYGWLTRSDNSKLLRFILHFLSSAGGIGLLLLGFYKAMLLVLLPPFKISFALQDVVGPNAQYDFAPFILLGILIVGVYHLLLMMVAKRGLIERRAVLATETTIAAIIPAFVFWSGIAFVLYSVLRASHSASPASSIWEENVAAIVVGLVYIPLDFLLWRRNGAEPTVYAGARRGFVLAVLGASILAFAIGGAVALYAWATFLFGSPIADWLQVMDAGLAAFIVGSIVTALYLTIALREGLFTGFMRRTTPIVPIPPAQVETLERVLDELVVGRITRDEAAQRIRELEKGAVGVAI